MPKIKSRNDLSFAQKALFNTLISEHFAFRFIECELALLGQTQAVQEAISEYYANKYTELCKRLLSPKIKLSEQELKKAEDFVKNPSLLESLSTRARLSEELYLIAP